MRLAPLMLASCAAQELPEGAQEAKRLPKTEPYVACEVCKMAVGHVWAEFERRLAVAPYGKLSELELQTVTERICDHKKMDGQWITKLDIKQTRDCTEPPCKSIPGAPIFMEAQDTEGECKRECATIAHACRTVLDETGQDIAETLYKLSLERAGGDEAKGSKSGMTEHKLVSRVCKKWTKSCPGKPVPATFRHKNEYFMPVDEETLNMRRMQEMMNEAAGEQGKQPVQFVDPMGAGMSKMFDDPDEDL